MIQDFVTSIYKLREYHKFKKKPIWKTMVYLLVLSLIFGLLIVGSLQNTYAKIIMLLPDNYDSKIPEFVIENNELKLDRNERVVIEKDGVALVFDESAEADAGVLNEYKQGAAVLKDRIIIKTSRFKKMEKYWKDLNLEKFDKETLKEYLGMVPSMMLMLTVMMLAGFVLFNFIFALFISGVFVLIKHFWKKKLKFSEIFRLTVHSMTVPVLLIALASATVGGMLEFRKYFYAYYVSVVFLLIIIGRDEYESNVVSKKPAAAGNSLKGKKNQKQK